MGNNMAIVQIITSLITHLSRNFPCRCMYQRIENRSQKDPCVPIHCIITDDSQLMQAINLQEWVKETWYGVQWDIILP